MTNDPNNPLDEYNPDNTVYATSAEDEGSVTFGSAEEYDRPYHDPNWLYYQYHVLKMSAREIGEVAGVAEPTIRDWMRKHDIPTRSISEARRLSSHGGNRPWENEAWLREHYLKKEKSTAEIAAENGVSPECIREWLERKDIDRRDRVQSTYSESCLNDSEWLRVQYVENEKSTREIADDVGCSASTVRRYLREHEIDRRGRSEAVHVSRKTEVLKQPDSDTAQKTTERIEKQTGNASFEGPAATVDLSWSDISERNADTWAPYTSEEWLKWQYFERGLNAPDIAEQTGVSSTTIYDWMDRFGLDRGHRGEGE